MTDRPPAHLADDALNEYLDEALSPAARVQAQAHLAACEACAARLEALRALFAGLEALPDLALTRDLAPAVTQAVRRRIPPRAPQAVVARRPWLPVVVAVQALVALALIAAAWPYVAGLVGGLGLSGLSANPATVYRDLLAALQALFSFADPNQLLAGWQSDLQTGWAAFGQGTGLALPSTVWLATTMGAGLVWLFSHLWLLRGPASHMLRRR